MIRYVFSTGFKIKNNKTGTLIDKSVCLSQSPLVSPVTLRAVLNYRGDRHQKIQNSFYLISDVQVKCFIRVSERFDKTIASAWKIAVSIILCNGRPA